MIPEPESLFGVGAVWGATRSLTVKAAGDVVQGLLLLPFPRAGAGTGQS